MEESVGNILALHLPPATDQNPEVASDGWDDDP